MLCLISKGESLNVNSFSSLRPSFHLFSVSNTNFCWFAWWSGSIVVSCISLLQITMTVMKASSQEVNTV